MKKTLLFILGCLMAVARYFQHKFYTHNRDTLSIYINEAVQTLLIATAKVKSGSPYSSNLLSIHAIGYKY